jgi:hypothetical protein
VQLQLRRPSDGGVSAPRPFEFLPLDAGRAYWSAKRLKTNYHVFNQILSADQAARSQQQLQQQQQHEAASPLRHKIRSDAAPTHAQLHPPSGQQLYPEEIKLEDEDISLMSPVHSKQLLKPVAMPGAASSPFVMAPILQPGTGFLRPTSGHSGEGSIGAEPPAVPVRSPHKSSLLQSHLLATHQLLPQPPLRQPHQQLSAAARPMSDLSLMSDITQYDDQQRVSLCTQQSVNELLSLAEFELDNVSVNTFMMAEPLSNTSKQSETAGAPIMMMMPYHHHAHGPSYHQLVSEGTGSRKISEYLGGSLTSVATVKEVKASPVDHTAALPLCTADELKTEAGERETSVPLSPCDPMAMDLDISQIYDDVMQCVYDDVDTKYDDLTATLVEGADGLGEPPVPPMRKRGLSIDRGVDRPLPTAPRVPTIIDKIADKKNELLREREREAERRKVLEEAKRKEREAAEEAKRLEREEKERRKQEERERRRAEEEAKRSQKRKEEEERRAVRQGEGGAGGGLLSQSLFQRLFQRNPARQQEDGAEIDSLASGGE